MLDELDPSFWSLENYLKAVQTFSSPYYQELSLDQLIKSYAASLCLQKIQKDNHYYEKNTLFESPNLSSELGNCQNQLIESNGKFTSNDKMLQLISTLHKLSEISNQIKIFQGFDLSALYQSSVWPNESSISTLAHFFPVFNDLFPLKNTNEKAEICLVNLKSELESATNDKRTNLSSLGSQGFEGFINTVSNEVNSWYSGNLETPTTPRKRSFDLVDANFNNIEETSSLSPIAAAAAAATNPVNLSSPLVTRTKSQMRKRRRFSVA